jgi:hypothetical protein
MIRLQVESDEFPAGFESFQQRSNNMQNDEKAKMLYSLKKMLFTSYVKFIPLA